MWQSLVEIKHIFLTTFFMFPDCILCPTTFQNVHSWLIVIPIYVLYVHQLFDNIELLGRDYKPVVLFEGGWF